MFILVQNSMLQSIIVGKSRLDIEKANHITTMVKGREKEIYVCLFLRYLSLLQPGAQN